MDKITLPNQVDMGWLHNIEFQKRKVGNQGNKSKIKYKDLLCAFDIETTHIKEIDQSVTYVWQLQLGLECTVIGRTWDEFKTLLKRMCSTLNENEYYVFFVHNLSYEFQFLRGIFDFKPQDVFALDSRRILKCTILDHIEFRCSAIHSNLKLKDFLNKYKVANAKLSGDDYDYSKMRFPWTELSNSELQYQINDVKGLVQAIDIEMSSDNDNLYTYPLTNTGYVRRDVKVAMRDVSHTFVRNQLPNPYVYKMLREAFRGGNTHANRYYANTILEGVKSADRVSSYPDVLCNCKFPVSKFMEIGPVSFEKLHDLIYVREKAVVMRVSITNLRLRNPYFGCPYIPRDKSRNIHNAVIDNGRIISADYLEMTITDIDFKIILGEYDWDDFAPFEVCHARYGKLPKPLIETIIKYFRDKTELKGVKEQQLQYDKSKNKINSIYGMTAQDPVKANINFIDDEFVEDDINIPQLLEKSNKNAFLCYQWGVWTTAWSRYRLEEGIMLAGEGFVYTDTDGVKYIGDIDWDPYNKLRIADSIESGAYAKDIKGKTHYMGIFEAENDGKAYDKFITLGAKKYCYETDGELHITVAGLPKHKGEIELKEMGGIKAFKPKTIFSKTGKLSPLYNDNPNIGTYRIDGHEIDITSNMVLKEVTYKLDIGQEYEEILNLSKKDVDKVLSMRYT